MREGSAADALWLRGVCRAWDIPFHSGRLSQAPRTEAEARTRRYALLERMRERIGATSVMTAHQADDQAETVLFRALRGAGVRGLRGILERRDPSIVRPFLPFGRAELVDWAGRVGLRPRLDPSNDDARWTRNRIRHELLPLAEAIVPGAGRALSRLAGQAGEWAEGWETVLDEAEGRVRIPDGSDGFTVARPPLLVYHSAIQRALLQRWIRRLGGEPGPGALDAALAFVSGRQSGREIAVGRGVRMARDFDRLVFRRVSPRSPGRAGPESPPPDQELLIAAPNPGVGEARIGGEVVHALWGSEIAAARWVERFDPSGLRFPLRLRGWEPGDRIRLSGGSKKLKRLFSEARIPRAERGRIPVLTDASGGVVWVAGVSRAHDPAGEAGDFLIGIGDAGRG